MELLVTTKTNRAIARDYVMEYGTEHDQYILDHLHLDQSEWLGEWNIPPRWIKLVQGVPAHFIW